MLLFFIQFSPKNVCTWRNGKVLVLVFRCVPILLLFLQPCYGLHVPFLVKQCAPEFKCIHRYKYIYQGSKGT